MSTSSEALAEQLAAEIELVEERLEGVRARIREAAADLREKFEERADAIDARAEWFRASTAEWLSDPYLLSTVAEDLSHAVDALSADLETALETDAASLRARMDQQLRTWRARAERLRLQEALAEMEIRDDLASVSDRLRHARARALVDLRRTGEDAKGAAVDLRDDLEELVDDVRRVVDRAVHALTDR